MVGYILTELEKDSIQNKEYAPYQLFHCVQDINNVWFTFLTSEDEILIADTEYNWILNCTTDEYVPPIPLPFPPLTT
jgi:hypothetical protein